MNALTLALVLLSGDAGPPLPATTEVVYEFATLTERQALALNGSRGLYRIEMGDFDLNLYRIEQFFHCRGEGRALRTLRLAPEQHTYSLDMIVEATLIVTRHPAGTYSDGTRDSAFYEYRLDSAIRQKQ
jgi:hypothetical protein